jgi:hypothetical protein
MLFRNITFLLLLISIKAFCELPPNKPKEWDHWKFNQKILWRSTHLDPRIPYAPLVDKITAKQVVQEDIKSAQTYFATDDPSQIFMENLPDTFIMKANNACGRGILVKNGVIIATRKRETDFQPIPCTNEFLRSYAEKWLSTLYAKGKEMQYGLVKPMVFFEEYIEGITHEIELYFFNGKVRVITLFFIDGYTTIPEVSYYDENWNLFNTTHPLFRIKTEPIEKPAYIDELIAFSERLVKKIDHVRVDFFIKGDEIYFGEFTFTTGGGHGLHHLNKAIGKRWKFPSPKKSLVNPYLNDLLKRANCLEYQTKDWK